MSAMGKMMLVAGLGRRLYGKWRFQRLLHVLVSVFILSVAAAVIMTAIVIGGFYAVYHLLLSQGIGAGASFLILMLLALLLAAALLDAIRRRMLEIRASFDSRSGSAVDAFFDGLFSN